MSDIIIIFFWKRSYRTLQMYLSGKGKLSWETGQDNRERLPPKGWASSRKLCSLSLQTSQREERSFWRRMLSSTV